MSAVLVTGSSGFIGRNLVERLAAEGRKVYALARRPQDDLPAGAVAVQGDILQPATYASVLPDCSALYHCAAHVAFRARDAALSEAVNIRGTREVFRAAARAGVARGVLLSACAVLGISDSPLHLLDENATPLLSARNVYARSKLAAEEAVREVFGSPLTVVIANISTVYGRGDRSLNSGSIIRSVRNGMKVVPPGGTSYVGMDDLLEGLLLMEARGQAGERYILSAENLTYVDLVRRITAVIGMTRRPVRLPRVLRLPAILAAAGAEWVARNRPGLNLITPQIIEESFGYKYFDASKARRELGWRPRVSLEQAVAEAIDYYRQRGMW